MINLTYITAFIFVYIISISVNILIFFTYHQTLNTNLHIIYIF